jgi:hypothetical protein
VFKRKRDSALYLVKFTPLKYRLWLGSFFLLLARILAEILAESLLIISSNPTVCWSYETNGRSTSDSLL